MHLRIEDKVRQEIFVAIFQILKHWSSHISMQFDKDKLYIQTMDKSHVCLTAITIKSRWFNYYECSEKQCVCVDSGHFSILMGYALKHNILELKFGVEEDPDKLYIHFLNKKGESEEKESKKKSNLFEYFFELNLIDMDDSEMVIPAVDYDVEFNIESKKWVDVLNELNTIGEELNIVCKEDLMELNVSGDVSKLKINIPVEELNEYAIAEDSTVNVSYSLGHLSKMCCSSKLSLNVDILLSDNYPMMLKYDLGEESAAIFYIAPKISDNSS